MSTWRIPAVRGGAVIAPNDTGVRRESNGYRLAMTMTTKILSFSLPVPDQDRALAFYTEVLGFEVRRDDEGLPGARMVEVAPPGSPVSIVLLPPDSDIPIAVRLATTDAEAALARLRASDAHIYNEEVLHLDGSPPMFVFGDPDDNELVYLEVEA
jgi:catechol 2,3-dioxygenase-like lactoylglutathione lyase family enzyme